MKSVFKILLAVGMLSPLSSITAHAVAVDCNNDPTINYMTITNGTSTTHCLGSGVGNLNGQEDLGTDSNAWDDFLTNNPDDNYGENSLKEGWLFGANYDFVDEITTWSSSTVSISDEFWASVYEPLTSYALGFKFGNHQPDNWFVYSIAYGTNLIEYVKNFQYGLSHVNLYSCSGPLCGPPDGGDPDVPLPAAFWLFGSALLGFLGFSRKKSV